MLQVIPFPPNTVQALVEERDEAVAVPVTHLIVDDYFSALAAALRRVVPEQVLLGTLADGRLRVKEPIVVKCMREDDNIVAEAAGVNEFGFGQNVSEAIRDLQAAIVELYFTLETEQDRLGPDLQRVRGKLQEKIVRVK
jgi:hypothetical protein